MGFLKLHLAVLFEGECEQSAVLSMNGAVAAGVKVSGHVALPAALGKAESDVCLVAGNLVENAVAAACGQMQGTKFIQVDARMQGGLLSLCIKNSGAVPLVYRHGALWSTRRNAACTQPLWLLCAGSGRGLHVTSRKTACLRPLPA